MSIWQIHLECDYKTYWLIRYAMDVGHVWGRAVPRRWASCFPWRYAHFKTFYILVNYYLSWCECYTYGIYHRGWLRSACCLLAGINDRNLAYERLFSFLLQLFLEHSVDSLPYADMSSLRTIETYAIFIRPPFLIWRASVANQLGHGFSFLRALPQFLRGLHPSGSFKISLTQRNS